MRIRGFKYGALSTLILAGGAFAQIQNQADDGQWAMPAKNYASTRFSTLDQINTGNVKNLKLAFTFSTGLTQNVVIAGAVIAAIPTVLFFLVFQKNIMAGLTTGGLKG